MSTPATSALQQPATAFKALIEDPATSAQKLADFLDRLSHEERVAATRSLGRASQRALWNKVAGFGAVDLEYYVPKATPLLSAVRHHGWNSLPLFRLFEKRFYRYEDGGQVAGANFQTISPLTGPGYFVCRAAPETREVLIDYGLQPSAAPAGWSAIVPNTGFPGALIYGRMVDRMRYVSEHVSVGSATRHGKDIGSWFLLCRRDAP